jgi:phosphoribosylformylglycinamidine synthase
MATPRVLILRAPGTNCDQETAYAFQRAGAAADMIHVNRLLEQPDFPGRYQILCVPGGFSYGDDVAAGRILGNLLHHHLRDALFEFREQGKLLLGICNGFQVLLRSGVLLPNDAAGAPVTLTWNDSGRFEARWIRMATHGDRCPFLQGIDHLDLPVAHAEGKFVARNPDALAGLDHAGQLVLRYISRTGNGSPGYPDNPNGSQLDVAGICDETGRVLGLMPHPERNIDPTHHPQWMRRNHDGPGDGFRVFQNAVAYFST